MFIHGYIPKSKKQKTTKASRLQHEEWLSTINSMTTNFCKNKSVKTSTKFPSFSIPAGRETPKLSSLDTGFVPCTKRFQNSYTGDKMKGIGTMHKSNAVPIFTDNEAKEISSMRR